MTTADSLRAAALHGDTADGRAGERAPVAGGVPTGEGAATVDAAAHCYARRWRPWRSPTTKTRREPKNMDLMKRGRGRKTRQAGSTADCLSRPPLPNSSEKTEKSNVFARDTFS